MRLLKKEQELEVKKILKEATACIIYTGAGMGADSGLAVFRGNEGLWEKYPEAGKLNLSFKELANPKNYEKYPEIVIPFYLDRYKKYKDAEPHSGYYELLGYVSNLKDGYNCVTSNVDGLFKKATFKEKNISEVHGSIFAWQCSDYNCARKEGEKGLIRDIENKYDLNDIHSLKCKKCNSFIRPNICMFEDINWYSEVHDKQELISNVFRNRLIEKTNKKVAIIEIGAGESIRTIKSEAELTAYDFKTKVIRINPNLVKSDLNDPDVISIESGAAEGVSYIMKLIEK